MAHDNMTYEEAGHAVQTGVKIMHEHGSRDGEPKHLRVGINLSKTDQAGLARLLIAKGIFTEAEYLEAIRKEAIAEVRRYEIKLTELFGRDITLG